MGQWTGKVRLFWGLTPADKSLFLRAVYWLAVSRIWLGRVPFAELAARLSTSGGGEGADPDLLRRVEFAVAAAARNVPWRSDCFPQAIAANKLLRKYGCASTIYLGVEKSNEGKLLAHAWLACGETIVTGGAEANRYVEIHRLGE